MKTLKDYVISLQEASLLDIEGTLDSGDEAIKKSIEKWIKDNFSAVGLKISNNPNRNGKYEVSASCVIVDNKNITSLTNGLFVWKEVKGYFDCSYCDNLTSLKGAPKEVDGNFICTNCKSLKTLEGAPKEVDGGFYCYCCDNLTSLKDAPNYVGGYFNCSRCKSLTSLKGAPKEVGESFKCIDCVSLKSIDLPSTTKIKGSIYK